MQLALSDLLTIIARRTGTQNSTSSSYTTANKVLDINIALSHYMVLANSAAGNWRPADDTNQTDYPIVFGDLVSGQQDYTFTVDEQGNQILGIDRVRAKNQNGEFYTLDQLDKDQLTDGELNAATNGTPTGYYLTANGIFLNVPPSYNSTDGLEISISRTPTTFSTGNTAKVAGIPWVHHEYLALRPSYFYCLDKGLPQAKNWELELYGSDKKSGMEGAIKKYWRDRNRAFQQTLTGEEVNPL